MFMNNIDVRLIENSRNLVLFCWILFFDALACIGVTIFVCLYSIVGRSVGMILIIFLISSADFAPILAYQIGILSQNFIVMGQRSLVILSPQGKGESFQLVHTAHFPGHNSWPKRAEAVESPLCNIQHQCCDFIPQYIFSLLCRHDHGYSSTDLVLSHVFLLNKWNKLKRKVVTKSHFAIF